MLRDVFRGIVVLLSSVIAVPYTVAVVCNLLYGWPRGKGKFRRALSPKKVIALNCAMVREMMKVRYLSLWLRWKQFYSTADRRRLIKDLPYGRNDRCLDMYLPETSVETFGAVGGSGDSLKPVIIFVHGGTWSSGDKAMYGLLCANLADKFHAMVCCPSLSCFPQGYVDDMIQDVVDCVAWVFDHVALQGGDKNKIILMGHSSGAHLCMMSVLELLHDEWATGRRIQHPQAYSAIESIKFDEKHFNGDRVDNGEKGSGDADKAGKTASSSISGHSPSSSVSFDVLNSNNEKKSFTSLEASSTSFIILNDGDSQELSRTMSAASESMDVLGSESPESEDSVPEGQYSDLTISKDSTISMIDPEELVQSVIEHLPEDEEEFSDTKDGDDSIITVTMRELDRQPTLVDLGKTIKGVIGLAGVYNISDHFLHESKRGVEDVSCMTRVMYGPEHFDRFSPSVLVKNLPTSVQLPTMLLVHGTDDATVPPSSSTIFAEALLDISARVTTRIVPSCGHMDICVDLMDNSRNFYEPIIGIISEAMMSRLV